MLLKGITGKEQESICIRHVDVMHNVHEEFMGTCELTSNMTSNASIQVKLLLMAVHSKVF